MMDNKDKWLEFKNYLHNELGISNDQIREWVKEAVEHQVDKMLQNEFEKFSLSNYIVRTLSSIMTRTNNGGSIYQENGFDSLKRTVSDKLAKMFYNDITIKKKNE
jgi:hypothetical protein